jgi:RNA polymerase sigma-70 factor (ECF subfamily)
MDDPLFHSVNLRGWLGRIQSGDAAARDELLRACQDRLFRLTQRMLHRYPSLRRWTETDDVFQNASLRLLRALEVTPVADTREFFNLAASIIRRELIDLTRHFHGPMGIATHEGRAHFERRSNSGPAAPGIDPADLDRWAALHDAAEKLPAAEREVFGLIYYHGWSQDRIAELFGVDERTVRRRMRRAQEAITAVLGCDPPN